MSLESLIRVRSAESRASWVLGWVSYLLPTTYYLLVCGCVGVLAWLGSAWPAGSQERPRAERSTEGEVLFRDRFEPPLGSEGWHPVSRWGGGVEAAGWASDRGRRGGGCLVVASGGAEAGWERRAMPAVPGALYGVRGWLRATIPDGGACLGIAFASSKGGIVGELRSEITNGTTDWRLVSASGPAPAEAALVTFFCSTEGKGEALFDDVTALISVPPQLRLVSWEFPKTVIQGEEAVIWAVLVPTEDVGAAPSLAAFVSPLGAEEIIIRRFQRLMEPQKTWRKDARKQVEMAVFLAGQRYPPGRYLLRLELRNATWADARGHTEAEFEILSKPPPLLPPSLGLPIYEGPREVKAGQRLGFSLRTSSVTLLPSGRAFAWLSRADELWAAAAFAFPGGEGEIRLDGVVLDLPEGIPPGDYELAAGIVGAQFAPVGTGVINHAPTVAKVRIQAGGPREGYAAARPLAHGVFTDLSLVPHSWWVNQYGTLFWDAEPCLPVGTTCSPAFLREYDAGHEPRNEANWRLFNETLKSLHSNDLSDLLIIPGRPLTEIPASALQRVVDELEAYGFRYGIELNAGPRQPLRGYWVNSGVILRDVAPGIDYTAPPVVLPLPEKAHALYLALESHQQEALQAGLARLPEEAALASQGRFTFRLNHPDAQEATVFFTPQVELDASSPQQNLWEGFEESVRELGELLSAVRFGSGLRFFVDPLRPGLSYGFPSLLPNSEHFREEYQKWLETRFGTVEALQERWCLSGRDLASFQEASNLVPMALIGETGLFVVAPADGPEDSFSADKPSPPSLRLRSGQAPLPTLRERGEGPLPGLPVFRMDLTRSPWWLDWLEFRDQSVADKLDYVASRIKEVVDVPVVVGHDLATAPYHVVWRSGAPGIDGVASRNFRGQGSGVRVSELETRNSKPEKAIAAYGAARQSAKSLWCLAIAASSGGLAAPLDQGLADETQPSKGAITQEVAEILSCGAKGIYIYYYPPNGPTLQDLQTPQSETLARLAELRRQTNSARNSLAEYGPPLCYWLPAERPEESIFYSSSLATLSLEQVWTGRLPVLVHGRWIVPAWRVPEDSSPLVLTRRSLPSAMEYLPLLLKAVGQDHRPRAYIGHLFLSEGLEGLQEYFTGQLEPDSDGALVQVLAPSPSSEVFARTPSGGVWHLRDGTLEIMSKPGRRGHETEADPEEILPTDSLRIFDIAPEERYYSPVEFGREFLGVP